MSGLLHGADSAVGDLADRAAEWIKQRLANSPIGVIGDKPSLDTALAAAAAGQQVAKHSTATIWILLAGAVLAGGITAAIGVRRRYNT